MKRENVSPVRTASSKYSKGISVAQSLGHLVKIQAGTKKTRYPNSTTGQSVLIRALASSVTQGAELEAD